MIDREPSETRTSTAARAALKDIIGRLEKATGHDRSIDADIHVLVTGKPLNMRCEHCGTTGLYFPRSYTLSIDDALTLVPEGYAWGLSSEPPEIHGRTYHAAVCKGSFAIIGESADYAPTPAIALCIAALKARASVDSSSSTRPEDHGTPSHRGSPK